MAADGAETLCPTSIANRLDKTFLATLAAHLVPFRDPPRIEGVW